ncbi:MAG: hypothetical protein IID43_03995 [Planctomycetes bacterium]|nr:hypothetical protein [Planctomycetota bacterium]
MERRQGLAILGAFVIAVWIAACGASDNEPVAPDGDPDIYAHGFEDGTVGNITNNVNQPTTSGTVIDTDGARGTHSLRWSYGTTPGGDGGAGAFNYILPERRTDVWVRFAWKYDGFPTSFQKIFRVKTRDDVRLYGSLVYNGNSRFSWFWDDMDVDGLTHLSISPTVGEWHWWEFHYTIEPGVPLTIEIYYDDSLVLSESSGLANENNLDVVFFIFDGTLNKGNTNPFTMLFDELGISSQKMRIPPG